jgi:hypothetical protein
MAKTPHNWSLVSAGVNADIIAPIMAKEYGKVCIDYGHGMNVWKILFIRTAMTYYPFA